MIAKGRSLTCPPPAWWSPGGTSSVAVGLTVGLFIVVLLIFGCRISSYACISFE